MNKNMRLKRIIDVIISDNDLNMNEIIVWEDGWGKNIIDIVFNCYLKNNKRWLLCVMSLVGKPDPYKENFA